MLYDVKISNDEINELIRMFDCQEYDKDKMLDFIRMIQDERQMQDKKRLGR